MKARESRQSATGQTDESPRAESDPLSLPRPFVYSELTTGARQLQSCVASERSPGLRCPKYLLSSPFQKKFSDPCS